jgi:hypothetical protein
MVYRKAISSQVWHWSPQCTTWPKQNYIQSQELAFETSELCNECVAIHALSSRTCSVSVGGKPCGLTLTREANNVDVCPAGHRLHSSLFPK